MSPEIKMTVAIEKLYLWNENPRHDVVDSEMDAIESLCRTEDVAPLARDIVRNGVNPAERLIVFPIEQNLTPEQLNRKTTFFAAEGNRRLCALKLLHDPDKAPIKLRATLQKLADLWVNPVGEVDVVVIFDEDRRRHWLRRIHDGTQGGVGRKAWSPEQKTRFSGSRRNVVAQQLFDYAESKGMITADQRKGNLSHMARLVGNVLVSEALGLDLSKGAEEIMRTRPTDEFDLALMQVLSEAQAKRLGSQAGKKAIDDFARSLHVVPGVSLNRVEAEPLFDIPSQEKPTISSGALTDEEPESGQRPAKPKAPRRPEYIVQEEKIAEGLEALGLSKLQSLYYSICRINARDHTPLVAVGAWSLLESFTAAMGRPDKTPFKDFLNKGRLAELGLGSGKDLNAPVLALGRLSNDGNVTKHHSAAAHFDSQQLINDMSVLAPVLAAGIEDMKKKRELGKDG